MNLNDLNIEQEDIEFLSEKTKQYLIEHGTNEIHLNNKEEAKKNIEGVLFAFNELKKRNELISYTKQKESIRVTKINPKNNPYSISTIITNHSYKMLSFPMVITKLKEMGICGHILLDTTSHKGLYSMNRFLCFDLNAQYDVDFKKVNDISIDKEFVEFLEYLLYRKVNLNATVLNSDDIANIKDKIQNIQENKYIKEYKLEGNQ